MTIVATHCRLTAFSFCLRAVDLRNKYHLSTFMPGNDKVYWKICILRAHDSSSSKDRALGTRFSRWRTTFWGGFHSSEIQVTEEASERRQRTDRRETLHSTTTTRKERKKENKKEPASFFSFSLSHVTSSKLKRHITIDERIALHHLALQLDAILFEVWWRLDNRNSERSFSLSLSLWASRSLTKMNFETTYSYAKSKMIHQRFSYLEADACFVLHFHWAFLSGARHLPVVSLQ